MSFGKSTTASQGRGRSFYDQCPWTTNHICPCTINHYTNWKSSTYQIRHWPYTKSSTFLGIWNSGIKLSFLNSLVCLCSNLRKIDELNVSLIRCQRAVYHNTRNCPPLTDPKGWMFTWLTFLWGTPSLKAWRFLSQILRAREIWQNEVVSVSRCQCWLLIQHKLATCNGSSTHFLTVSKTAVVNMTTNRSIHMSMYIWDAISFSQLW